MKMNNVPGTISGMNKWSTNSTGGFRQKWLAKVDPTAPTPLEGLRKLRDISELSEHQRREIDQIIASMLRHTNRFRRHRA